MVNPKDADTKNRKLEYCTELIILNLNIIINV